MKVPPLMLEASIDAATPGDRARLEGEADRIRGSAFRQAVDYAKANSLRLDEVEITTKTKTNDDGQLRLVCTVRRPTPDHRDAPRGRESRRPRDRGRGVSDLW